MNSVKVISESPCPMTLTGVLLYCGGSTILWQFVDFFLEVFLIGVLQFIMWLYYSVMMISMCFTWMHLILFYPKDPRSPVEDVVISSLTMNTMTITWKRPSEPRHCKIDRYIVNYTSANCEDPELLLSNETVVAEPSAELTGLLPNWEYTFYVNAFTSPDGGGGDSMSQVFGTTSPDGTDRWI